MAEAAGFLTQLKEASKHANLGAPIFLIVVMAMMTLRMPPFLLDILFTFNIALALVVLLVSVYSIRPLDFAVFPTILLVATLLRLALNVASTRVVLLEGHNGGDAAGKVIQAFGEVVIGGNYAVGLVVFLILVIINFVVVTKGAGRIAEVSARFTLDAMPGKQMAIDADLNSGLIDQDEAKRRRTDVAQEADFYGAMDGASKFVRGDAIAGILILIINIVGGLAIGMGQHDLAFVEALKVYALLTIGDGLVAQIPSLLLSTSAALIVTRTSNAQEMGAQIFNQMFSSPQALAVASGILCIMGLVPGMPHLSFLGLSAACAAGAYWIYLRSKEKALEEANSAVSKEQLDTMAAAQENDVKELGWDDVQPVDAIGLEVGYRLIPLVDKTQGGQLLGRIKGVRKKLSQEMGFLMPSVHIRDNLDLLPNSYRVTLMGVSIEEAEIHPDRDLAINPGQVFGTIQGIAGKDPAFGLDAVWIEAAQRDQAQTMGYTVVDASTVVATHINQIMQKHAHELLGFEEVQKLLDNLQASSPKLVESLVPNPLPLSRLHKVLQNLLQEGIPIKDIRTIAEALAEVAPRSQDTDALTGAARISLARLIVQTIYGVANELPVITLQPELEQLLLQSVSQAQQAGGTSSDAVIEPGLADKLQRSVAEASQKQELAGQPPVLLVSTGIRSMLSRFLRFSVHGLNVLSYNEIPDSKQITIVSSVGQ
ncbi:flagellar biosynthesis protein FlhA [Gammaproteobacteria bacterium 45_16_T64]|nr:flagellar biosynthesis protein FlhA [Gammaproteobacteria bacterium 45_16_T64]